MSYGLPFAVEGFCYQGVARAGSFAARGFPGRRTAAGRPGPERCERAESGGSAAAWKAAPRSATFTPLRPQHANRLEQRAALGRSRLWLASFQSSGERQELKRRERRAPNYVPGYASEYRRRPRRCLEQGSVLIIVLWIAFGLVALALYFAHSMSFELRTADNRVAAAEADEAIEGAARYVSNILATADSPQTVTNLTLYSWEALPVDRATFWVIGRGGDQSATPQEPVFGLVDEASKLNLNTATPEMLELLPGMTAQLAGAIVDWRDTNSTVSDGGGAEDETYQRLNPPYRCKNADFESVDELRLVFGMDLPTLYGEDANLNGALDPNENDGDTLPPPDNRDGHLDAGLFDYVTVYSKEPNVQTNGSPRINITDTSATEQLRTLLQTQLNADRANQIMQQVQGSLATIRSPLEFFIRSGMKPEEFAQIEDSITVTNSQMLVGLVNVSTASEAVLACIPGIGVDNAPNLVSYRQSHPDQLGSVAWVAQALDQQHAIEAGPYLTARSYQFTADIAAVGHYGRGYRRVKFVFDISDGSPRIIYREDLSYLGWALGDNARQMLLAAKERP